MLLVFCALLMGCNSDKKNTSDNVESNVKELSCSMGVYCSNSTSEYVWLKSNYTVHYYIGEDGKTGAFYELSQDKVEVFDIMNNELLVSFNIIDENTLSIGERIFERINELNADGIYMEEGEIQTIKRGWYFSESNYDELWFVNEDKIQFVFGGSSSNGVLYDYMYSEGKLLLNRGEKTLEFQIISDDMLMRDGVIFHYKGANKDPIEEGSEFSRGLYRSETTTNYVQFMEVGKVDFKINDIEWGIEWKYNASKENVKVYRIVDEINEELIFVICDDKTLRFGDEVYRYVADELRID